MATTMTKTLLGTLDDLDALYEWIEEACDEDAHPALAAVRAHHLAMLGALAGFPDDFRKLMNEARDA